MGARPGELEPVLCSCVQNVSAGLRGDSSAASRVRRPRTPSTPPVGVAVARSAAAHQQATTPTPRTVRRAPSPSPPRARKQSGLRRQLTHDAQRTHGVSRTTRTDGPPTRREFSCPGPSDTTAASAQGVREYDKCPGGLTLAPENGSDDVFCLQLHMVLGVGCWVRRAKYKPGR